MVMSLGEQEMRTEVKEFINEIGWASEWLEDKYEAEEKKRLIKKENTVAEVFNLLRNAGYVFVIVPS